MIKNPPAIADFDSERNLFFSACSKILRDDALPIEDKSLEIESTIAVLRQMALMAGVSVNA